MVFCNLTSCAGRLHGWCQRHLDLCCRHRPGQPGLLRLRRRPGLVPPDAPPLVEKYRPTQYLCQAGSLLSSHLTLPVHSLQHCSGLVLPICRRSVLVSPTLVVTPTITPPRSALATSFHCSSHSCAARLPLTTFLAMNAATLSDVGLLGLAAPSSAAICSTVSACHGGPHTHWRGKAARAHPLLPAHPNPPAAPSLPPRNPCTPLTFGTCVGL